MGRAITVLAISISYALFLFFRFKSFMGSHFLILSGDHWFNFKGIEINTFGAIVLWSVAAGGIILGIALIVQELSNARILDMKDRRKCPKCAEFIMIEATICKHCRHQIGKVRERSTRKILLEI